MAEAPDPTPDPAFGRLMWMSAVRLLGILVVLVGLWIAGKSEGDTLRMVAGLLVIGGGGMLSLLVPRAMARHWRSRP